jgi:hypothetical protein
MADENAYTGISLNGNFSDDGELFLLTLDLNGVPIRFGNIYVADQREAFTEAKQAGQPKSDDDKPAKSK